MPNSLQDQLKKSGLIDDQKAKQLKRAKTKHAEKIALAAQIKQLVEMNSIAKDGEQKFSFTEANVIKHI